MSRAVRGSGSLLILACLAALPAAAAPPNGTSQIVISGPGQIFVPAGHIHSFVQGSTLVGDFTLTGETDVAGDIAGAIGGSGLLDVDGIAVATGVPITVSGKVSGRVDRPKAKITTAFEGELSVLGFSGSGKGSLKLSCAHDDALGLEVLPCRGKIKFCGGARGVGHACAGAPFATSIPAAGGDWTLSLELATDASNRVTGDAVVELGNGTLADFTVTGKYSPKTDTSSLKLTGVGPAAKAKVALTRFAADGSAGLLKFKLAGQSGRVDLSTLP